MIDFMQMECNKEWNHRGKGEREERVHWARAAAPRTKGRRKGIIKISFLRTTSGGGAPPVWDSPILKLRFRRNERGTLDGRLRGSHRVGNPIL